MARGIFVPLSLVPCPAPINTHTHGRAVFSGSRADNAHASGQEPILSLGFEPTGTTAGELAAIMAADTARWVPPYQGIGIHRRL